MEGEKFFNPDALETKDKLTAIAGDLVRLILDLNDRKPGNLQEINSDEEKDGILNKRTWREFKDFLLIYGGAVRDKYSAFFNAYWKPETNSFSINFDSDLKPEDRKHFVDQLKAKLEGKKPGASFETYFKI